MTFEIAQLIAGPATAVLASWFTYRFASRQATRDETRNLRSAAASELYVPLRELQLMLRRHGRVPLAVADVAYAFCSFFDAYNRQRHRLPEGWAHVGRSVRAAAGTALGGVSFVDLDPSPGFHELAEPDGMWRDFADDYIDYVVHQGIRAQLVELNCYHSTLGFTAQVGRRRFSLPTLQYCRLRPHDRATMIAHRPLPPYCDY